MTHKIEEVKYEETKKTFYGIENKKYYVTKQHLNKLILFTMILSVLAYDLINMIFFYFFFEIVRKDFFIVGFISHLFFSVLWWNLKYNFKR